MAMGNQVQILTNLKQIDVEPRVSNGNSEDPLILIVEDHEEMCQFIESILVEDYRTITAANGTEGIETAFKAIPDLIITDIMMPGIDGIELNKALKRDIRTSHIPVIMLTAKNDIESKLQGLESGAEAYLTKPFSKKELLLRLHNIFELRKKLHLHYWAMFNGSDQQLDHLPFSDFENDFLNKIKQIIEDQIDDPQFDVEKLAKKALLSYSQLYRKLKSLTGHTPIQYIHEIRLKRAKEMLTSSDLPISEIAFQVGIEDPVYFTRIFKKKFGETPSHLRSLVKS
jgi:YesN/AraC family two-component response regulator